MPGGDGTGPLGLGPRTGRGLGYCAGYPTPGYITAPGGGPFWRWGWGGFGRGWGRGYRWRRWWWAPPVYPGVIPQPAVTPVYPAAIDPKTRMEALKSQRQYFQSLIKDIETEMENLQKEEKEQ